LKDEKSKLNTSIYKEQFSTFYEQNVNIDYTANFS